MNDYSIALFWHIVGALGFFVALGLEWMSLGHVRRATTAEQVRERMHLSNNAHRVAMPSMLMILITGFYMMATVWGHVAWIIVALGAVVLLVALAVGLSGRRMAVIGRGLAAEHGPVSPFLHDVLHHPLLWISIQTRVAIALGIVFLMTAKPDLRGSLLAIVIAAMLGLASALPILRRE
jgi:hypothetical protein